MADIPWAQLAEFYDAKQGDRGDLWHRHLIDPVVLRRLGSVRGLAVLDLACGNGYLSRRIKRAGAREVLGVDASAPIIARARQREAARPLGIRYLVRDAAALRGVASARFDVVLCNMALMDIADARGALREVGRVLRPGGRLVFSICHPCFDLNDRSGWVVERTGLASVVWRKVSGYRREDRQHGPWRLPGDRVVTTAGYHRTLSSYSAYLAEAGLAIRRMDEPAPDATMVRASPQGPFLAEIPLHLVVEAIRGPPASARPTRSASRTSARSPRRAGRRSGYRGRRRGSGSARRGSRPGS